MVLVLGTALIRIGGARSKRGSASYMQWKFVRMGNWRNPRGMVGVWCVNYGLRNNLSGVAYDSSPMCSKIFMHSERHAAEMT